MGQRGKKSIVGPFGRAVIGSTLTLNFSYGIIPPLNVKDASSNIC